MTTQNQTAEFDISTLLDGTLDALADMPEFKAFTPGTYKVRLDWVDKTAKKNWVANHPGFELKIKNLETVESNSGSEAATSVDAETSILYLLDNEMGQGQFKKVMAVVAEKFGAGTIRELVQSSKGSEAYIVTKQRQNKEKTQTYTELVEIQFA